MSQNSKEKLGSLKYNMCFVYRLEIIKRLKNPLYKRFLCYCSSTVGYIEKSQRDSNQVKFPTFVNVVHHCFTAVLTAGTIFNGRIENFIIFNYIDKNKFLIQFRPYLARCEITPNLI